MQEDWTEISDAALRKRIQNRLAQRKHRRKTREQIANQVEPPAPASSSTTPTNIHIPATGDSFFPPQFAPVVDAAPEPEVHVDDVFEGTSAEDSAGELFAMEGFGRPQWNMVSRPDVHMDAMAGSGLTDRHTAGLSHLNQRAPMVSTTFDSPSSWGLLPQQEVDPHDHTNRHSRQPVAGQGFPDDRPLSPQTSTVAAARRRYGPASVSGRMDHDGCSECAAQQRPCHRRSNRSPEDPHTETHVCNGRRLSTASSSTHRHGSPSSSGMALASRSDLLRDQDIDLNQILSQIEPDRRGMINTASRSLMTGQSQSLGSDSIMMGSRRSMARQDPYDHHMAFSAPHDYPEDDYPERSGPRVRKVVVIYMDERDHE